MENTALLNEFEIQEIENVEALSETAAYWFAGLAVY